jgi:hypothetical protein
VEESGRNDHQRGHAPARGGHSRESEIHVPVCGRHMATGEKPVRSWEALEHGGGVCEEAAPVETYRSSFLKTKFINLYKSENRLAG